MHTEKEESLLLHKLHLHHLLWLLLLRRRVLLRQVLLLLLLGWILLLLGWILLQHGHLLLHGQHGLLKLPWLLKVLLLLLLLLLWLLVELPRQGQRGLLQLLLLHREHCQRVGEGHWGRGDHCCGHAEARVPRAATEALAEEELALLLHDHYIEASCSQGQHQQHSNDNACCGASRGL